MENSKNSQSKNESQSCEAKVRGVTNHNYYIKAAAFANGEYLAIDPYNEPQQWAAWRNYFKTIKLRGAFKIMGEIEQDFREVHIKQKPDNRGPGRAWTVPAAMPSDFDEDREWFKDRAAGDEFMRMEK